MEGIVLAGGLGKRLRSVISDVPKPMAPIGGTPFIEILLKNLAKKGFRRIVISLGYQGQSIRDKFGNQFCGMELDYVTEDSPLGTGGATRLALNSCRSDHVFVFNGDTFLDIEVDQVESMWQKRRRPIVVARNVSETGRYGGLYVVDHRIIGFAEKSLTGPGLINAGCYILQKESLNAWELNVSFSLEEDFFAKKVSCEAFYAFVTDGLFIDIGVPTDFYRAQALLSSYI